VQEDILVVPQVHVEQVVLQEHQEQQIEVEVEVDKQHQFLAQVDQVL
jgi:metal-dependent HD superfamily phosphatase/phosphodiesterase